MDKIKIYVIGGNYYYTSWINNYELVDSLEEANIVMFTGGEDVTPSYYGHKNINASCCELRDKRELGMFQQIKSTQLAIGICRGLN